MKKKFTVIAGTSHRVIESPYRLNAIATWFHTHYSHKIEDLEVVENLHKKAQKARILVEGDLIYQLDHE
jgi:hypothetical protein